MTRVLSDRKEPFLDIRAWGGPCAAITSLVIILLASMPDYNDSGVVELFVKSISRLVSDFIPSLNLIIASRPTPDKSLIILAAVVLLSPAHAIYFLCRAPIKEIREKYLTGNKLKNLAALIFSSSFFTLILIIATLHSLVINDWGHPSGRFSKMLYPIISTDIGLGVLFLIPELMAVYSVVITLKALLIWICDILGGAIYE